MNPAGPARTPPGDAPNQTATQTDARGFPRVLAAYTQGDAALSDLRQELSESLYENPAAVPAITSLVEQARESEALSTAIYRLLLRDIKHITTEETPTDPNLAQKVSGTVPDLAKHGSLASSPASRVGPRSPLEPRTRAAAPQAEDPVRVGVVLRDRYELTQQISEGPMGRLFRATDRFNEYDAVVAIKVLGSELSDSADALKQLKLEVLNARRLGHPNIVNVFEIDRHGSCYFIAMEWLSGESLASLLDRTRPDPMPKNEFSRILRGLSQGLTYAHDQAVVHGDIKPGNVFLADGNRVKLIDFGVARSDVNPTEAVTEAQPYGLTQSYASCEVLAGEEPEIQDDVFALSLLAYRMLAGHRPFGGGNALHAEAEGIKPERPPDITDRQWKTLQAGMAFRRPDRLLTVTDLADGLLDAPRPGKRQTKRRWPWVLAATLAGFAAGVQFSGPVMERVSELREQYFADTPAQVVEWPAATAPAAAEAEAEVEVEVVEPALPGKPPTTGRATSIFSNPPAATPNVETEAPVVDESGLADDTPAPTLYLGSAELPEPAAAPEPAPEISDNFAAVTPEVYRPSRPLGFVQEQYTVNEGDGFIRLAVASPGTLKRAVTLRVVIQEGTAVPGEDFAVPALDSIVVAPDATTVEVFVPLIADSEAEFIEDFVVRLISLDAEYQVANSEVIVIILDDDGVSQPEVTSRQ